jgi:glutathione S-transferase
MASGVIKLYQFPTAHGIENLSPFCMKAEVFLRLAGLPYEIKWTPNPGKGPLGKLPFIRDVDGTVVADSENIIEYLTRTHELRLDAGLSPDEKAIGHAFQRMLSEHTYFALVYHRWINPKVWPTIKATFFGPIPAPLRGALATYVQRKTLRDLKGHGLGRHSEEEINRRAAQDLAALGEHLNVKPYFMGDKPTSIDATIYAFIANMWEVQIDTPLKAIVGKHKNLVAYCERMRARCFKDS